MMNKIIIKFILDKYNYKFNSAMFNRRYKQIYNKVENYRKNFNAYDKSYDYILNRMYPIIRKNKGFIIYF